MDRWSKIIYHTYRKGECLCEIAKKYNVDIHKLAIDNDLTNIDFLIPRTENKN